jgi:hypothetical protein
MNMVSQNGWRLSALRKNYIFVAHDVILYIYRAGGVRGASVENLKGTQGAQFAEYGVVSRGAPGLSVCCGGASRKECFLLIKGPFCFVFTTRDAPAPSYAIGLQDMQASAKTSSHSGRHTVVLEKNTGEVEYEFSFENMEIAKQFKIAIDSERASAHIETVRKKLGHENLIRKRASLVFAETIAKEKVADQPAAPVSTQEIITTISPVGY